MMATTLGSLMVQAQPIRSPRWAAARVARSGRSAPGRRAPPSRRGRPATAGWVKWWKVTTGTMPVAVAGGAHPAVVLEGGQRRTRPRPARSGSTRARSGRRRGPRSATRSMSSGQRWNESQASPLGSTRARAGSCSQAHQSLLTLPPSIWWAAVAAPQRNRRGSRARSRAAPWRVMAAQGSGAPRRRARRRRCRAACEHGRHERVPRVPRRPAGPRAHRGQHLPGRPAPTRSASGSSAARWPARR